VTSAIPSRPFLVTVNSWKRSLIARVSAASLSIRPFHATSRSRVPSGFETGSSMFFLFRSAAQESLARSHAHSGRSAGLPTTDAVGRSGVVCSGGP
jgi:hypothetical protein